MSTLSRDAILAANDLPTVTVNVPEWGGDVVIRAMTGAQRDEYEQQCLATRGDDHSINMRNLRARLVVFCAADENGNPLFGPGDVEALGNKSAAALDRLFDVAQRLNRLSGKDIDELGKRSASDRNGGTGSASPAPSDAASPNASAG